MRPSTSNGYRLAPAHPGVRGYAPAAARLGALGGWLVVTLALLALLGCGGEPARESSGAGAGGGVSETAAAGEKLFNTKCATCHGVGGVGSEQGPPLMHKIYAPGHHPDFSFRNAAFDGVRAHHWNFGDMLPVPGVTADDVDKIICYVRETQRANGIYEGDGPPEAC